MYFYQNVNNNLFIQLIFIMKNLLYVIAALLAVIWGVIIWGFNPNASVHLLLAAAVIIILIRLAFDKQLSKK